MPETPHRSRVAPRDARKARAGWKTAAQYSRQGVFGQSGACKNGRGVGQFPSLTFPRAELYEHGRSDPGPEQRPSRPPDADGAAEDLRARRLVRGSECAEGVPGGRPAAGPAEPQPQGQPGRRRQLRSGADLDGHLHPERAHCLPGRSAPGRRVFVRGVRSGKPRVGAGHLLPERAVSVRASGHLRPGPERRFPAAAAATDQFRCPVRRAATPAAGADRPGRRQADPERLTCRTRRSPSSAPARGAPRWPHCCAATASRPDCGAAMPARWRGSRRTIATSATCRTCNFRRNWPACPLLPERAGYAWATKGFEPGTGRFLHELVAERLPGTPAAVVTGPSFAREVAAGMPTAVTVHSADDAFAHCVAELLHSHTFRAYTGNDMLGAELGGAMKNVLAVATGVADGMRLGLNARAGLITRGMNEMLRLGAALGAQPQTLMGLAGLGDLVLTCTAQLSRNYRFGFALGQGVPQQQALAEIGQVVEGAMTADEGMRPAARHGLDLSTSHHVQAVLRGDMTPTDALQSLRARERKPEYPENLFA